MKNPFANLLRIPEKPVPKKVEQALKKHFPDALNIDWEHKKTGFEAIFYLAEVEHISLFSPEGVLLELKKNLWQNEIPETIAKACLPHGEIMNSILINRGGKVLYEIIVRDKELNRWLLLFDKDSVLLESEKI
jgi:hypothetical protein